MGDGEGGDGNDGGGWGGETRGANRDADDKSIEAGNRDRGDSDRAAAIEAGSRTYSGPGPTAGDFNAMLQTSPTPWQSAKLAYGLLSSPITGMYSAVKFNQARLAGMTPAQIENERQVRAEIEASQQAHGYGSELSSGYVNPFAQPRTVSTSLPVSGGAGAGAGSGSGAGEVVASGADQTGASSGSNGPAALFVTGDSSLAKLAALATIAGVFLQAMG